ncbi:MAG TPA: GNAT family N-acetyltransferase [Solirubrobacteraceae bacterium]|nr:GNAT family N-acetyltransferase [Solirubrobacteraceae bacterium]
MRIRGPEWEDAPAVLALLVARHTVDIGLPLFRLEEVQDEWRSPDVELGRDAQLIEIDGALAGYGIVHRPGAFAVVAPAHEGRGVGARLLEWVQQRERERAVDAHRQIAASTNPRARELLEGAGYRQIRSYWRMARPLDRAVTAVDPPPGIHLRTLDLDRDAKALHALDAESFASSPDYVPESYEMFVTEHLRAHDVAPDLSLVAQDGGEIVGFLLARRWHHEASGYVDLLAVAPGHQRRGIGTALLTHAFTAFATAGLNQAQLGVASDNPRGLRVYQAAGMGPRFQFDVFERPLDCP